MNGVFKAQRENTELLDSIVNCVKDKTDPQKASYNNLNMLIEIYNFYPVIVKKDKNISSSIYQVMNAGKTSDANVSTFTLSITYSLCLGQLREISQE